MTIGWTKYAQYVNRPRGIHNFHDRKEFMGPENSKENILSDGLIIYICYNMLIN